MSKLARNHRNADLARMHIARKDLGLTEADYRAILQNQTGKNSGSQLTHPERLKVLAYFEKLGWKPKASSTTRRPKRPTPAADSLPLVRRIRAQLISLDRKPDEYADGIAKQMFGAQAPQFFEWCTPSALYKISQALGVEQDRKGADRG